MNTESQEEEVWRPAGRHITGYCNRGPLVSRPARPPQGVAVSNAGDLYVNRVRLKAGRPKKKKKAE